jgi:ribosomal protein S6--L-glutamate ligase
MNTVRQAGRARVALIAEERYLSQLQPAGLADELRARGVDVHVVDPGASAAPLTDPGWLEGFDALVARGRSEAVLCALLGAERRGIPTINRHGAVLSVYDKAAMAVALAAAGVRTLPTWLGDPLRLASDLSADAYPVVVKPVRGDNCRGIALCAGPSEVGALQPPDGAFLAQPYMSGDGQDLKLYGIADAVWAVRKPSPLRPGCGEAAAPTAAPVRLTPEAHRLARACRKLFELDFFGVDCLVGPEGPVVVEVNEFPNYTGVPEASAALADRVLAGIDHEVRGAARLEAVMSR